MKQFLKEKNTNRHLYFHYTCAKDAENIHVVFDVMVDTIFVRNMKKLACNNVVVLINTDELILLDHLLLRIFLLCNKTFMLKLKFHFTHTVIITKTRYYADTLILRGIIHGINLSWQICIWWSGHISSCLRFLLFSDVIFKT